MGLKSGETRFQIAHFAFQYHIGRGAGLSRESLGSLEGLESWALPGL